MTLGGLRAGRSRRARLPRQLLRSRCLRALGGQASADRGRVGGRGAAAGCSTTPSAIVWQWTRSAYSPYPGFRAGRRRARRIQRQVHGQPDGAARLLARDARRPCARHLPQLLLSAARAGSSPACALRTTPNDCADCPHGSGWQRSPMQSAAFGAAEADRRSRPTCSRASRRRRSGCRRSISTTPAGSACSSRSPSCPNTTRRAPSSAILKRSRRARSPRYRPGGRGAGRVRQRLEPRRCACCSAQLPTLAAYVPVDISAEFLDAGGGAAAARFPAPRASLPVAADFTATVRAAGRGPSAGPRVGFFPGLDHRQFRAAGGRRRSCAMPRASSGSGAALHRRRRPREGRGACSTPPITTPPASPRAFNLNLLARINRELGGQFRSRRLRATAPSTTAERSRIEMHLASRKRADGARRAAGTFDFARRRDDPHREQLQVHARRLRARSPRRRRLASRGGVDRRGRTLLGPRAAGEGRHLAMTGAASSSQSRLLSGEGA